MHLHLALSDFKASVHNNGLLLSRYAMWIGSCFNSSVSPTVKHSRVWNQEDIGLNTNTNPGNSHVYNRSMPVHSWAKFTEYITHTILYIHILSLLVNMLGSCTQLVGEFCNQKDQITLRTRNQSWDISLSGSVR